MPERMGHTEPFQSGQNSAARDKGQKVPIKFKMRQERNIGQPDSLIQALTAPPRQAIKDTQSFLKRGVTAGGQAYRPYGAPLRGRLPISGTKATGMGSHTSRPGQNALGSPRNLRGDNPLGGHGGRGTFRGRP